MQVRLPHFLSVALRKADVVAVLLAFTGYFTFLHNIKFNSFNGLVYFGRQIKSRSKLYLNSMSDTLTSAIIVIPVLLFSMSLHEMLHAFTSHWLGDDTAYHQGRVSLNPLRHIDPLFTVALPLVLVILGAAPFAAAKPVQVNFNRLKYGEFGGAIVGMVGPLTNLIIAIVAASIFRYHPPTTQLALDVYQVVISLNVGLFIFNSIPWPPLDGSRLLYAFAPRPLQEFMESIERMGLNGLLLFMFVFLTFLSVPLSTLIRQLSNWLIGSPVF